MILFDRNSGNKLDVSEATAKSREALGAAIAKALTADVLDAIGAFVTPKKETAEERAERVKKGKALRCMVALTIPMPALKIKLEDGSTMETEPFTINANAPLPTGERNAVAKPSTAAGTPLTMAALTLLMKGQN